MISLTKIVVEQAALGWLSRPVWTIGYVPDIAKDSVALASELA